MTGTKSPSADALAMVNPGAAAIDIGSTMHMAAINPHFPSKALISLS